MSSGSPLLIGVDVGTTRIKAGAIDLDGNELGHTQVATIWQRGPAGVDARPDDFSRAVEQTCEQLLADLPAGEILGVGIASMAETAVLIGPAGDATGPAIAWHDRRAEQDLKEMDASLTRDAIGRTTGLGLDPIPTIAVLRWLMRTESGLRAATRVLSVAEWIAYGLTGVLASELSLASRTGALSIARGQWWSDAIDWAGLPHGLFADLQPAGSSWGTITAPRPELERLAGAVVTVAGHDHLAAAIGCGITGPDQIMDSCGTAEALVRAIPIHSRLDPAAGLPVGIATGWHALPGCHCLLAGLPLGIELTPLLEQLNATVMAGRTSLDEAALAMLAGELPPQPLITPAREWLTGVKRAVDRAAGARHELERLGGSVAEVRVSGGWVRNPVVRTLKELDFPRTVYPLVDEAGVRGAGLIAGVAAGVFRSVDTFPAPPLQLPSTESLAHPDQKQGSLT